MWRSFGRSQSSDLLAATDRLHADSSQTIQRLLATVQRLELECESLRRAQADMAAIFEHTDVIERIVERVAERLSRSARPDVTEKPMPARRGQAGGLARARNAWRYADGTFMPEGERVTAIQDAALAEYERFAAGGRKRAASANRAIDGTFLPDQPFKLPE
jgi:hypothetical protein